ncbi:putative carboxypeptidase C [Helianthus anomalus]
MNKIIFSICITFTFFFFLAHSAPENAAVSQIPGFDGTLPSKHYAGYVTIDENHGKKLYYYYVLSERNPSEDPVVLWLNGGPGCSSFDGFVYEHGPFNFEKTGGLPKLHLNPYAWTKWFKIYPEYLSNPFFISGESYAGVYVPMLSYEVVKGNGVADEVFDGNAIVPFAHGMGLISDELYEVHFNFRG